MDSSIVPATAGPSVTEDALAAQPIGYWSGAVHKAVVNQLRDAMSTIDVTQPQWWTLTRVDAGGGLTPEDVATQLEDVADTPHQIPRAIISSYTAVGSSGGNGSRHCSLTPTLDGPHKNGSGRS